MRSLALLFVFAVSTIQADESGISFNRDIRPILAENCFACHGQDANKRAADLRLDLRESAIEFGAIVEGEPDASELVVRIKSDDPDEVMPPKNSNRILTEGEKQHLERWIASGARYETHWAFEAPVRPGNPTVSRDGWIRNPIDGFVLAKLEANDLPPSPEANRTTLIRRLSIDLTGLPPSPSEIEAFVTDKATDAYERLVDRLLDSKHYGERMALPWLDAARYADSNGFQQDGDTWQWIWRDWVVKALNDDLPFDQFTIWQLAGDLLPNATTEQKIASGFNRNHLLNGEGGAIAEEQRWVNLFDRIDTTATTWLGLTMACAQCHDHKYDPITQKDYYSLLDAFNRVPERGTPKRFSTRIRVDTPFLELPTEENKKRIADFEMRIANLQKAADEAKRASYLGWKAGLKADGKPGDATDLSKEVVTIFEKPEGERSDTERKRLEEGLRRLFADLEEELLKDFPAVKELDRLKRDLESYKNDQIPRVMIMSDDKPRETHVLDRGQYLSPLEKVSYTTPAFLPQASYDSHKNRLGFARWLVSDHHPLTARVQVNRMWQHFFGTGIVKTSEDFGVQSEYPIHKDLLDWLAVEFRESGWSMKRMHRLIVTSATYRQSSKVNATHLEHDAANRLFSRSPRFRMPSMILRDWALASSGLLDDRIGGVPVYPYQPDNVWEALAITKERDFTYPASSDNDLYRRSLYTFWRRTVQPANMFDSSNRQACRVRASVNNTPLHALTMLNDKTWVEAARVLAEKSMVRHRELKDQLHHAFFRVLSRRADDEELLTLQKSFAKQLEIYRADHNASLKLLSVGEYPNDADLDHAHHAALTSVCLGIFNLDEAMTRE